MKASEKTKKNLLASKGEPASKQKQKPTVMIEIETPVKVTKPNIAARKGLHFESLIIPETPDPGHLLVYHPSPKNRDVSLVPCNFSPIVKNPYTVKHGWGRPSPQHNQHKQPPRHKNWRLESPRTASVRKQHESGCTD